MDDVHCGEYGIWLLNSKFPGLPSTQDRRVSIPGRDGAYDFGFDFDALTLSLDVAIEGTSEADVRFRVRQIAAWLDPRKGQRKLVFDADPDRFYYVRFSGSMDVEMTARIGQATLTFLVADPYAYGEEQTIALAETYTIHNPGTADAFPVFDVTLKQPTTFLALVTPDQFMLLGNPDAVDQTPVVAESKAIYDPMDNLAVWQTGTYVEDGLIQGSFKTTGVSFQVADFGPATGGWAGPALKRSAATPLQDFRVEAHVTFRSNSKNEMGRLEIYLLDPNGSVVAKMSIYDIWSGMELTKVYMRAGTDQGVMETFGKSKGALNDFDGLMKIQRKGTQWTAYLARIDANWRNYDIIQTTFNDMQGKYQSKVAQVEIHMGRYQSTAPTATMAIGTLTLYELDDPGANEVPYIGDAGDTITIDHNRAAVYRNGEPMMSLVDPSSDFFALPPGDTSLSIEPWDAVDSATVTLQPRYL
ncbi:distal tail protein Dit [Alicyclobacillus kakegawensis]|uniref:distal tail protein Dit n=1 Tax=Alicyclobacillus kakegawensis TaxID=392012 RepID=UPI0014705BB3|nr:distal tail protein Dit [Alicyclobacillus kakegawensis]